MLCFIKKSHERKQGYLPSHFYKENYECKKRNIYAHNMHSTNIKVSKNILVEKVEKSNDDVDVLDNLNSKDDIDSCSSSYTTDKCVILFHSYKKRNIFFYQQQKKIVESLIFC